MKENLYYSVNDFCFVFMCANMKIISILSRALFTMGVPFVIDIDTYGHCGETVYIIKFKNNSKFEIEKLLILLPHWIKLVALKGENEYEIH